MVNTGTAGERAPDCRVGDEILAIDGQPISHFQQLVNRVKPNPGRTVTLQVRRDGRGPRCEGHDRRGVEGGRKTGLIGIAPKDQRIPTGRTPEDMLTLQKYSSGRRSRAGSGEDLGHLGVHRCESWVASSPGTFRCRRSPARSVSRKQRGFAARQGWRTFLGTLALISISLGVLNLLPIPILDGGQVVYQLAELVKGGPVSERAQLLGQQIGIAMLILMMTLAFYNDIARHLN